MAHLSKELTGVILSHYTWGTQLDTRGRPVHTDSWSNIVIDKYIAVAENIKPNLEIEKPPFNLFANMVCYIRTTTKSVCNSSTIIIKTHCIKIFN